MRVSLRSLSRRPAQTRRVLTPLRFAAGVLRKTLRVSGCRAKREPRSVDGSAFPAFGHLLYGAINSEMKPTTFSPLLNANHSYVPSPHPDINATK